MWSLSLITPPALEALDMGVVYEHLRLEPSLTPQEALLLVHVNAASQEGERISRRQFISATWELWMDSWCQEGISGIGDVWPQGWPVGAPWALSIPRPPLQSITSVKYLDSASVEQTWDSAKYLVEAPQGDFPQRGRLRPKAGESWPSADSGIKVRFVAGYGATPDRVPGLLRSAMLLLVGDSYENRELQSDGRFVTPNVRSASRIFLDNRAW